MESTRCGEIGEPPAFLGKAWPSEFEPAGLENVALRSAVSDITEWAVSSALRCKHHLFAGVGRLVSVWLPPWSAGYPCKQR